MTQTFSGAPAVRLAVLGPVRAWRGTHELNLGPRQQRQVLALLLARAGRYVTIHELVDLLWGRNAPASATNSVHRFIGALRHLLEPDVAPRSDGKWILRRDASYSLVAPAESVDLLELRRLAAEARDAENRGLAEAAIARYGEALALSRGRCADDGTAETHRHPAFVAVDEEYASVARDAARAALTMDGAGALLPPIRRASEMNPLDEALQARMMRLMAADGRQADAFALFQMVREALSRELGVDPGPELREAYDEVLRPPAEATAPTGLAQLPRDLVSFTGRREQLDRLTALLREAEQAGSMPIVAIDGMPGVGKSTLAVHWSYQVAGRFPDGQLYLDLRGHRPDAEPVTAAEALQSLLATLGVAADSLPAGVGAQAAVLRSHLAGRRLLVLLDNAESDEQVRHLLPGGTAGLVLITSRVRLAALNARDGAELFTLDTLAHDEARSLLSRRLTGRLDDQNQALDQLVELSGRLPSALAGLSSYMIACPQRTLEAVLADVHTRDNTLDLFAEQGVVNVRESFATSYHRLTAPAARLFRLAALHPGPEMNHVAAASLAGLPPAEVRPLLAELDRSHLLHTSPTSRLSLHSLVRRYASELSATIDSDTDRSAARERLIQHYRHTADAAYRMLRPPVPPVDPGEVPEAVTLQRIPDYGTALSWFRTEIAVLERLVDGPHGWQMATTLVPYYRHSGLGQEWLVTMRTGLRSAERLGDRAGQAHMYRALAGAHHQLGDHDRAHDDLGTALHRFGELGLAAEQAYVRLGLGDLLAEAGRHREAIADFERGQRLFTEAGNENGVAASRERIASCLAALGDRDAAVRLFERAAADYLRLRDENGVADCMLGLGSVRLGTGDNFTAIGYLKRAIELYRRAGNAAAAAETLIALGDAHLANDEPDEAFRTWRDALDILEDLRLPAAVTAHGRLQTS
ncbi:tetratricopeptide repeat protein [Actinoplanes sp. TBRC 11911]|uniref:AfsR/SARP family transcriptional regulator n=1 Tax=Actinoplanes sp. TBRC 11911 TaxID=2729386 RepID=UPI00145E42BF|nr:BTAD domain-containing putative transcriptional regulator [Actinoplanes sp. TBRC 11911]NMO53980.1 tetratricopeptide repeat protein [Actinoplanes sp. TBRC 11911]